MNVLIGTDVLLGLALHRIPHASGAAALVDALARRSALAPRAIVDEVSKT